MAQESSGVNRPQRKNCQLGLILCCQPRCPDQPHRHPTGARGRSARFCAPARQALALGCGNGGRHGAAPARTGSAPPVPKLFLYAQARNTGDTTARPPSALRAGCPYRKTRACGAPTSRYLPHPPWVGLGDENTHRAPDRTIWRCIPPPAGADAWPPASSPASSRQMPRFT